MSKGILLHSGKASVSVVFLSSSDDTEGIEEKRGGIISFSSSRPFFVCLLALSIFHCTTTLIRTTTFHLNTNLRMQVCRSLFDVPLLFFFAWVTWVLVYRNISIQNCRSVKQCDDRWHGLQPPAVKKKKQEGSATPQR